MLGVNDTTDELRRKLSDDLSELKLELELEKVEEKILPIILRRLLGELNCSGLCVIHESGVESTNTTDI